jgi:DNA-binding MarR family transcriptional regulator
MPSSRLGRMAEQAKRAVLVERTADALRRTMMAMRFGGRGFKDSSMTPVAWVVLRLIKDAGELTPSDLARRMGVAAATVTRILNQLEGKGFVERVRKPEDRRVVHIRATPKVAKGMQRFRADWVASAQDVFDALSDAELNQLLGLLHKAAPPLPSRRD